MYDLDTCGYLDTTDTHFVKAYWQTIPPHLPMEVRTVATGVAFGRPIAKTIGQIRSRFYSTNDVPLPYKMVVCQILGYLDIEIKKDKTPLLYKIIVCQILSYLYMGIVGTIPPGSYFNAACGMNIHVSRVTRDNRSVHT